MVLPEAVWQLVRTMPASAHPTAVMGKQDLQPDMSLEPFSGSSLQLSSSGLKRKHFPGLTALAAFSAKPCRPWPPGAGSAGSTNSTALTLLRDFLEFLAVE